MTNQVIWLQDVSLETFQPGFIHHDDGTRQMQLSVSKQSTPLQHETDIRVDMRLLCTISVGKNQVCIADISAASFAEKQQFDVNPAEIEDNLYRYIRDALGGLLGMSHYTPPLPEHLNQIKE